MEDQLFPRDTGDRGSNTRRLPVYLLLDTSGSMSGGPIAAVQRGAEIMRSELLGEPTAVQTVHIKVITFSTTVHEEPMVPLTSFQVPQLSAGGTTALGAALRQLDEDAQFGHDLVRNTAQQKGDYLPIVFILTDGEPTDPPQEFSAAASRILQRVNGQEMNVFAIACGPAVAPPTLHQITNNVLVMSTMSEEQIRETFRWIGRSVARRSQAVVGVRPGGTSTPTEMPPPPPGLVIM